MTIQIVCKTKQNYDESTVLYKYVGINNSASIKTTKILLHLNRQNTNIRRASVQKKTKTSIA